MKPSRPGRKAASRQGLARSKFARSAERGADMNENEAPEDDDIEQQSASISEDDKGNGSVLTQIEQDAARDRIKTLMASTTAPMLEVGEVLSQVKGTLKHGKFRHWVEAELPFTIRTAQKYMAIHECFHDKSEVASLLSPETAYALAAPSTPKEVAADLKKRIRLGEKITEKDVKEARKKKLGGRQRALRRYGSNRRRRNHAALFRKSWRCRAEVAPGGVQSRVSGFFGYGRRIRFFGCHPRGPAGPKNNSTAGVF